MVVYPTNWVGDDTYFFHHTKDEDEGDVGSSGFAFDGDDHGVSLKAADLHPWKSCIRKWMQYRWPIVKVYWLLVIGY